MEKYADVYACGAGGCRLGDAQLSASAAPKDTADSVGVGVGEGGGGVASSGGRGAEGAAVSVEVEEVRAGPNTGLLTYGEVC
jgi:hypothetical protein